MQQSGLWDEQTCSAGQGTQALRLTGLTTLVQVHGVTVHLYEHSPEHDTPDAVFPNNWFSTHAQGEAAGGVAQRTMVYYPMKCPNRCCLCAC